MTDLGLTSDTTSPTDALARARAAYAEGAWTEAFERLAAADRASPLDPADLERLATAARLIGQDAESGDLWARAHQQYLARGDDARAARCAFWLAIRLLFDNEPARAGGWIARGRRLLDDGRRDCVELGYLLLPAGLRAGLEGDRETSQAASSSRSSRSASGSATATS